ncbi:putative membrane protein [Wickerhamomyces ciferrii]|uniref:Membrane protein n=1 Tax=Wickerhamomyces ciferrii (strain ATCC 14091 / BCRC 22168 / CBS 111 / JCM 3599 / NBRC 0793 / NRRL Y-1031 F-60-10) TaxID=1206466 RepID=K0KT91_WICCF|nr:uncharacterized protein BN7_4156 [Wickerhamomyces ciferrii]CCH44589.1 putative membrane protein [Wickerhamomyces ciferrii]
MTDLHSSRTKYAADPESGFRFGRWVHRDSGSLDEVRSQRPVVRRNWQVRFQESIKSSLNSCNHKVLVITQEYYNKSLDGLKFLKLEVIYLFKKVKSISVEIKFNYKRREAGQEHPEDQEIGEEPPIVEGEGAVNNVPKKSSLEVMNEILKDQNKKKSYKIIRLLNQILLFIGAGLFMYKIDNEDIDYIWNIVSLIFGVFGPTITEFDKGFLNLIMLFIFSTLSSIKGWGPDKCGYNTTLFLIHLFIKSASLIGITLLFSFLINFKQNSLSS